MPRAHSVRNRRAALARDRRAGLRNGYLAAVAGVALVSLIIALIRRVILVEDVSLLYLLVVLWLAITYGRWPAIAASVLAFLTFDVLFIPPYYQLTISDPAQWVSLFALLTVALAISQLTASIRAHAHEATESERRTAALYTLARLIASQADVEALAQPVAEQIVHVFAPMGVHACAFLLPDARGVPVIRALAPAGPAADALYPRTREIAALVTWASEQGQVTGTTLPALEPGALGERMIFSSPCGRGRASWVCSPLLARRASARWPRARWNRPRGTSTQAISTPPATCVTIHRPGSSWPTATTSLSPLNAPPSASRLSTWRRCVRATSSKMPCSAPSPTICARRWRRSKRPPPACSCRRCAGARRSALRSNCWARSLARSSSPYRAVTRPILNFIDAIEREYPRDLLTVVLPEFITDTPWEWALHNQTALRLKLALPRRSRIVTTNVPYRFEPLKVAAPEDPYDRVAG